MTYTLKQLADSVAEHTGFSQTETRVIADELIILLTNVLQAGEDVRVHGLGHFHWASSKGTNYRDLNTGEQKQYPPGLKLKFRPSVALRRRRTMEKYAVQLDEAKTKTAAAGQCPQCGAKLDGGGSCPAHGTKPFEARKRGNEEQGNGQQGEAHDD